MTVRSLIYGGALTTTGLFAGLLFAFSVAVMPGLRHASDSAFVEAMQEVNRAILNPAFFVVFIGAPLLTAAALFLTPSGHRIWVVAALGLHAASFVITAAANVPLNDALQQASHGAAQLTSARQAFEHPWVAWNIARTITAVSALACLVAARIA